MKKTIQVGSIVFLDILFINIAFLIAIFIHTEGHTNLAYILEYGHIFIVVSLIKIFIYKLFALYKSIWEYASIEELVKVVCAVVLSNILGLGYILTTDFHIFFGVYIVAFVFEIILIGGNRFSYRIIRRFKNNRSITRQDDFKRILVVGCGSTASLIAAEIKTHPKTYGQLIGFIDDSNSKVGKCIAGVKVLGDGYDILSVCKRHKIDEIILAIPTASKKTTKEILDECKRTNANVKIVPGIVEIIDGKVSMQKIRPVEIEDLLGRDPVDLNIEEIASYIESKTVMVTGGGGSIGSELCRQIIKFKPLKLVILDIYENSAYDLQNELLKAKEADVKLEILIASVRDRSTIFNIVEEQSPDVIFHAAAHKHVPLMECSPKEAVKNNVFGTLNVAEAAHKFDVKYFVLISTDKAVNPTNVMGATKRICEMVVQSLAKVSKTKFVAVRFGNVLGSNGSVIPLFKRQIEDGGPVTVTHKDIVRYFMTIPEAAQLVIQAGAIAKGGEIFVLDMGEPVKIYDLAVDLIKLSGLKPHEDIAIEITGLRPGEKLYEELLMQEEGLINTKHDKIYIGKPTDIDFKVLKNSLSVFKEKLSICSDEDVRELLTNLVPTFTTPAQFNAVRKAE